MHGTLPTLFLLALASAAHAETVLGEVSGNWAAPENNGYFYRAVLSEAGDSLRLRIYQGMSAATIETEPQFDNPAIAIGSARAGDGGRDWLEVGPAGELYLHSFVLNDGYAYTGRLTIRFMDNQFTATAYEEHNNGPVADASIPETPVGCFSGQCYSCVADLWSQTAVAGGESVTVPAHDFETLNATFWNPARAVELGYCPGQE